MAYENELFLKKSSYECILVNLRRKSIGLATADNHTPDQKSDKIKSPLLI